MRLTLLELTQNILSAMDSDEVNSVSDTTESRQIAQILKTTYYNMIARAGLPEHKRMIQLDDSGDPSLPVIMYRPTNVSHIDWIKYNKQTDNPVTDPVYQYVTILPLQQFRDMTDQQDLTDTTVDSLALDGFTFLYRNDKMPDYCAVIDDDTFIFDSYDSDVDNTLHASKTICFGTVVPTFDENDDDMIPELDEQQFPLYLNEAKSLAFMELKQITHEKAEQESRRQWRTLQRTKQLANVPSHFDQLAYFGRR